MKKRIIALLALVAMMATMLTVPVGAEVFVNDIFDGMTSKQDVIDAGWKPYNYQTTTTPDGMCGIATIDNGTFKIAPDVTAGAARPFWRRIYTASQNHIAMFNLKAEIASPVLGCQFFIGGTRVINKNFPSIEANTWYTVMIVVSGNATQAKIYYRKTAATDDKWTEFNVVNTTNNTNGTTSANTATSFTFGFDSHSTSPVSRTGTIWYDNFRVFDGRNVILEDFKLDSTAIDAVADVTAAGTLKTEISAYSDNVVFDTNGVVQDDKTYKTIMVAFDKDGKMLDCNPVNKTIKGGVTAITTELAIDATDAAAIADNGYIATYIWDGMQPVGELIKLGASPITSTHSDN